MTSTNYKHAAQKSSRLYALVGFLVLLLAFVAVTFYLLTRESRNEQEWIRLSTDLQVHSQQVAKSAAEAVEGNRGAFLQLGDSTGVISDAVQALKDGDPVRSLPALPGSMSETLTDLDHTWKRMNANARDILDRENQVLKLAEDSNAFIRVVPEIQDLTDQAIRELTQNSASNQQVFVAGRQLVLSDRILRHLKEMLRGGAGAVQAAENFTREIAFFEQTMEALLQGSRSIGISQVTNSRARKALDEAKQLYDNARPQLDTILISTEDILAVRGAADEIFVDSLDMFDLSRSVSGDVLYRSDSRLWPSLWSGSLALAVILISIAFMVRSFLSAERRRAVDAGRQNQQNQQAIMRLLDEMSSLADGDLTVRATVTDDMTGAIADAVNFAVEQLRELVTGINITARTVSESAQETMDTTGKLAAASGLQAEQVREATDTINDMAKSFDAMATNSRESNEVAQRSVDIAHKGSQMVQQTIMGMDTIRDQIQETSKRIKRLGESSQEIGDIVELINGIAEQTNILALNAAIQSASAGGAGRGFAVVADEVQRLAERATNATRRIEMLVQNIQTDTSEAVVSMETTTSEVVSGAEKAEDAGEALKRIESVSRDLSAMIEEISNEAQTQSETATRVADLMNSIRDVSIQTSEGTNQTAQAMGRLADLVHKLSESVADFKLPGDRGTGK
ncbi:MAG: methyl-accepting chemotaxis protein [Xanthomonadales bacterium]|jgi:twitching motility protein PilJ|nr:methyl-accepting chemotaxis protein [Xanthomonadales bacterium]